MGDGEVGVVARQLPRAVGRPRPLGVRVGGPVVAVAPPDGRFRGELSDCGLHLCGIRSVDGRIIRTYAHEEPSTVEVCLLGDPA